MPKVPSLRDLDTNDDGLPIISWDPQRTEVRLEHAWKWFSYHANQRLAAFNYFLVIVAVLITGYLTCIDRLMYAMQVILGFVGVVISMAFLALDVRNERLVNDGRTALRALERAIDTPIHRADYEQSQWKEKWRVLIFGHNISSLLERIPLVGRMTGSLIEVRHSFWLRLIERLAMLLFVAAIVHGLYFVITTRSFHGTPPAVSTSMQ
jgi:hypothetical protein